MTFKFVPNDTVRAIRAAVDHPILDTDAHQMESMPLLLDFIAEVGGANMPKRFIEYITAMRRTFRMTGEERALKRPGAPVWWPVPSENTLDRATSSLPKLFYDRMDEVGLDFSIVYPGMGMTVLSMPGIPDDELRQACCRAFNKYYAEVFAGLGDRLTPAAIIPMHTPEEAVAELDHAVGELGLKVTLLAGDVLRPIPQPERDNPLILGDNYYQDCFGIDSPHNYDAVWERCRQLKVAPTFHSAFIGRGTRASISRHQYNQLGGFAEGGEAICKSLFFGGVTRRFPDVKFGFLEGGAAWATGLYSRLVDHWKKRNGEAILHLDPARTDTKLYGELIDAYGHPRIQECRDQAVKDALWGDRMEELDDWRDCKITEASDIRDLFVPNFFFGAEGDDRTAMIAFDRRLNPYGAQLNVMLGSDIGHFDVHDLRDVLHEAYEPVEDGLIGPDEFRNFAFANGVRLHGGMNPDFFDGTAIEGAARAVLNEAAAAPAAELQPAE